MSKKTSLLISSLLIFIGVASRLIPHAWNMTPLTAIVLFASVYLGFRYSLFILIATMAISDFFIGFYQWEIMLSVYAGFAMAGIIGIFIEKRKTAGTIFFGAIFSSVLFFILTNWAVWQFGSMYEQSLAGLLQSFTMALPFFRSALLGDMTYSGIIFGTYELAALIAARRAKTLTILEPAVK